MDFLLTHHSHNLCDVYERMPPKKAAPKAKPATMKYTIDCQSLPAAKHDDDDDDWCGNFESCFVGAND